VAAKPPPLSGPLGAETGDKVPLGDLVGPAVMLDVRFLTERGKPGVSPPITAGDIRS
jgi:hypothetical protein